MSPAAHELAAPSAPRARSRIDIAITVAFLGLAAALAAFPMDDSDLWWHLRTGDLILRERMVPRHDVFTFGAFGRPWIDLHWLYQVTARLIYNAGGFPALNVAKVCVVVFTFIALGRLRRPNWPASLWSLSWLPALLLMSWRMTLRPETLSMFFLAIVIAIVLRWKENSRLAWLLPVVVAIWVNCQGLFVLGLGVASLGLVDALVDRRVPARAKTSITLATIASFAATLSNPYGIEGALFPWRLANTLARPEFSTAIDEFTPFTLFLERGGLRHPMFWVAATTGAVGLISFAAALISRLFRPRASMPPLWPRFVLLLGFGALAFVAVRNTYPFGIVAGTITAINFCEVMEVRREPRGSRAFHRSMELVVLSALLLALGGVLSGLIYRVVGEGRTVGLGIKPRTFPIDAAKFAGSRGMPDRFVGFHLGHNGLFEFFHGPQKKPFVDPRLEVMGVELFRAYRQLGLRIATNDSSWPAALASMGSPTVLVDHSEGASPRFHPGASLIADPRWRCVWFDSLAAVFAPYAVDKPAIDFAARHFGRQRTMSKDNGGDRLAEASAIVSYVAALRERGRPDLAWALALDGKGIARGLAVSNAGELSARAFGLLGQLEFMDGNAQQGDPRDRLGASFDPVLDLTSARAAYALERGSMHDQATVASVGTLAQLYESRGMLQSAAAIFGRLKSITAQNPAEQELIRLGTMERARIEQWLARHPFREDNVEQSLRDGWSESAMQRMQAETSSDWKHADRLASLSLQLGHPARAEALWKSASNPPSDAVRRARIAATRLVVDADLAIRAYDEVIALDPVLFEAWYGLAVARRDLGDADGAAESALRAIETAPNETSRAAARLIRARTLRYARQSRAEPSN